MICPLGDLQEPGVRGSGGMQREGFPGQMDSLHLVPSCHDRMNLVEESSSRREGGSRRSGREWSRGASQSNVRICGESHQYAGRLLPCICFWGGGVGDGREWGSGVPGGRGAGCLNKQLSENTSAYSLSAQRLQDAGLSAQ